MASAAAVKALKKDISAGREDLQEVLLAAMMSSKDEILDATEERSVWTSEQVTKRLAKDRKQLEGKIQAVADALETRLARESQQAAARFQALADSI
jgi:hypothetical protein